MKTIEDNSMMRRNTEVGQAGELDEYQLPRKVTLFRVVMERKLGIDWEHEPEEEEYQDSRMSLQTNEEVDKAFPELRSTLIDDSLPNASSLSFQKAGKRNM